MPQGPIEFDGEALSRKKQGADLADHWNAETRRAIARHEQRETERKATKEYYVQQNGVSIAGLAMIVVIFCAGLLWLNECAQRELATRVAAYNTLRKHANDMDSMRDDDIRRSVFKAEETVASNFAWAMFCRAVNDSVIATTVANYEGPFRRSLEGALQQDWFILAVCLTIIVGFVASTFYFVRAACTRSLWCGRKVKTT